MDPTPAPESRRFTDFLEHTLAPAVHPIVAPLEVAVYRTEHAIPHDEAVHATFTPASIGMRWGPVWSTAWFRVTGRVPPGLRGRPVALRFSCGTEALLWRDGIPWHGLDMNRDVIRLAPIEAAELGPLFIESACNRPLGATCFWWDDEEDHARWREAAPGRLDRCELVAIDETAWATYWAFRFVLDAMHALPADSREAQAARADLEAAVSLVENGRTDAALARLTDRPDSRDPRTHAIAAGHAHIDTAWLWPVRETRRKLLRSWATALRQIERDPEFTFVATSAQHYEWVREASPPLFAAIRDAVESGRWDVLGAMWIEPDANLVSGESLVRQLVHGLRHTRAVFGAAAPQRLLYLPDTFGFPACLPQLIRLAGLDVFVMNKLAWNETNSFPHVTFRWRGLDGTEVLAHTLPGHEYNATNTAAELVTAETNHRAATTIPSRLWFQPFGYGDGGGGPTLWSAANVHLADARPGFPAMSYGTLHGFRLALREERRRLREAGHDHPVWDGELYLERHRGTYTTQAWIKRANRRAERSLRTAEWLISAGPGHADVGEQRGILERVWRLALLNQFHDILPGTSIAAVYADARADFDVVEDAVEGIIDRGLAAWGEGFGGGDVDTHTDTHAGTDAGAGTGTDTDAWLVVNPGSWARTAMLDLGGRLVCVRDVPALGGRVVDAASSPSFKTVSVRELTLANEHLTVTIDDRGCVSTLRTAGGIDVVREPLNHLALYEDRPETWDAWELDHSYLEHTVPEDAAPVSVRVLEAGPARGVIEVQRTIGAASRATQRYVLAAGARSLQVETEIDWRENRRVLRALFPADVRADDATYGTQLGWVTRPTHDRTSHARAQFEVCAHGWMDLSQPGRGLAVLDEAIYGHSVHGHVMGLTLLRAPVFPDPAADRGVHTFTYALLPHDGDWRAADVVGEAEALREPLIARPLTPGEPPIGRTWAPVRIETDGRARLEVVALKPADDDDRLILRVAEVHGEPGTVRVHWTLPVTAVRTVDLLERPVDEPVVAHDPATAVSRFNVRAFEVATLAAIRSDEVTVSANE